MAIINLFKNRLKPKEVNNAVEANAEAITELNTLIGATPLPAEYTSITQAIEDLHSKIN